MKNFVPILLFLAAAIASCAPSQENAEILHVCDTSKTVVRTDTGVFVRLACRFDGLETSVELQKAKGSNLTEPYLRTAYGYDTLGNKILVINSVFDRAHQDYEHQSKEEYEYDEWHHPTLSTFYIEDNGDWSAWRREKRTFNERGQESSLEVYEMQGGDWKIKTKSFYQYDGYNNVVEETNFRADSLGEWHPVGKAQREYQKSLMVLEIVSNPAPGNKWAEKSKAEFEYNAAKQIVKSTSYIKRGNKWVNYVQVEYSYDGSNNITSSNTYFWNEKTGRWKLQKDDDDF